MTERSPAPQAMLTPCQHCGSPEAPVVDVFEARGPLSFTEGDVLIRVAHGAPSWAAELVLGGSEIVKRYSCSACTNTRGILGFDRE